MADVIFADGVRLERKTISTKDNSTFTVTNMNINISDFIPFLENNANDKGWVNLQICEGRNRNLYAKLRTYEKKES